MSLQTTTNGAYSQHPHACRMRKVGVLNVHVYPLILKVVTRMAIYCFIHRSVSRTAGHGPLWLPFNCPTESCPCYTGRSEGIRRKTCRNTTHHCQIEAFMLMGLLRTVSSLRSPVPNGAALLSQDLTRSLSLFCLAGGPSNQAIDSDNGRLRRQSPGDPVHENRMFSQI